MATNEPDNNPFRRSSHYIDKTQNEVFGRLHDAWAQANAWRLAAQDSINAIAGFVPQLLSAGDVPEAPEVKIEIGEQERPKAPQLPAFSMPSAPSSMQAAPQPKAVPGVREVQIATFAPSITHVNLPAAPSVGAMPGAPAKPSLAHASAPAAPTLIKPAMPQLAEIAIRDFDFSQMEPFDEQAPQFGGSAVAAVLNWKPVDYKPQIIEEVMHKLRGMWAGGLGIPKAVEEALFARAAEREDAQAAREVQQAHIEFGSRGFTLPPGALVARVDAVRQEAALRKQTLGRDVLIKIVDVHVENVRFACTQAIAAEQVLVGIWNAAMGRALEAAKHDMESQVSLLNVHIALYNARAQMFGVRAQVWKHKLDARLQLVKAQLEADLGRGQLNAQKVSIYSELMRALQTDVALYEAQMRACALQTDQDKNRIEMHKSEVQAWAQELGQIKVKADIYESQIKGETAKVGMVEAQGRAYASYVNGQTALLESDVKRVDAVIRENEARLRAWVAQIDAQKSHMQAQSTVLQAQVSAFNAQLQGYTAQSGVIESSMKLELAGKETQMRLGLAHYETQIKKYMADLEQLRHAASMQLEAMKAAAGAMSTMAAGATAGISIGAQVSGSASVSSGGSHALSSSYSKSKSYGVSGNMEMFPPSGAQGSPGPNDVVGEWITM